MVAVLKLVFFLVIVHLAFASTIYGQDGFPNYDDDSASQYSSDEQHPSEPESTDEHANVFDTTLVGITWKVVPGPVVPDPLYTGDFTTKTMAASVPSRVWNMGRVCGFRMIISCQGDGCIDMTPFDQIRNGVTIVGSNDETDSFIFTEYTFSVFAEEGVPEITVTSKLF